jgi:plastocyanin
MDKKTTLALISLVFVVLLASVLLTFGHGTGSGAGKCADTKSAAYTVAIQNNRVSLTDIHGKLCDTVTFINKDKITREIAFGPHEDHVPYDGVGEKFLNQNQRFTITLNQTGTFHWHDHEHDEVSGYFTVRR